MPYADEPCGSNVRDNKDEWNGFYSALLGGFPSNARVVITATDPNGTDYNNALYTTGCHRFGVWGSCRRTNAIGQLPGFRWSTDNLSASPDPPGTYHITFRVREHGKVMEVTASLTQHQL
jgi:hypothetical protein